MDSEKFCLRWNEFERNISVAFRELREDKEFFDVTLVCDDNQMQAHKVILSACSPFFRSILNRNPHQHPLLYLKGVKYQNLLSVLNFMYMGEVNVAQEELNTFLSVAEDLKVKGLTQGNPAPDQPRLKVKQNTEQNRSEKEGRGKFNNPLPRYSPANPGYPHQQSRPNTMSDTQEIIPVKCEPYDTPTLPTHVPYDTPVIPAHVSYSTEQRVDGDGNIPVEGTVALGDDYAADDSYDYQHDDVYEEGVEGPVAVQDASNADLLAAREEAITSHIVKDPQRKLFTCNLCQFGTTGRYKVFCHIEAKHFQDSPVTYSCEFCGKTASSRNALGIHMTREHKQERMNAKKHNQFAM